VKEVTGVSLCAIFGRIDIAMGGGDGMKEVVVSQRADKALQSMQPKRRLAIIAKVKAYARGERVDIKKMKGLELWRIRVGDDRVIIDDQGRIVLVVAAGPRGSIYKE
jgi:mRNA interferase RelE/StbE